MVRVKMVIHPSENGYERMFIELPRKGELIQDNGRIYEVKGIVHNLESKDVNVMGKELR